VNENSGELPHGYGPRVHILDNLFLSSALARLGAPSTSGPEVAEILRGVYRALLVIAAGRELPGRAANVPTRMQASHPEAGIYRGPALDPASRVVVADVIRAGIVPAQTCFEALASVLPHENVRLDHLNLSRVSDEAGRVVGVDLSGSKVGGSTAGATLFVPDPMGATGATTVRLLDHYLERYGEPAKVVTMPMIATPEYLRRVLDRFARLVVYTARLDRGLSPPDVLRSKPGQRWSEERGLDDKGYIVPGAGGMGELLNNAWC
jgi:uracil phosphoribosyltransferase